MVDPLSAKQGSATNDFDFVYRNLLGAEPEAALDLDQAANPLTYIDRRTVPFLIFHGTDDKVVPVQDSEWLYEQLIASQVPADLYILKGAEHMDVKFLQPQVLKIIEDFLTQHLQ